MILGVSMKLESYIQSLLNRTIVDSAALESLIGDTADLLNRPTSSDLSFWATKTISTTGFDGTASLDQLVDLSSKIQDLSQAFQLRAQENNTLQGPLSLTSRVKGLNIFKKSAAHDMACEQMVTTKNCVTRFFHWLRNCTTPDWIGSTWPLKEARFRNYLLREFQYNGFAERDLADHMLSDGLQRGNNNFFYEVSFASFARRFQAEFLAQWNNLHPSLQEHLRQSWNSR